MENVLVLGHGWSEGVTTPEVNDSKMTAAIGQKQRAARTVRRDLQPLRKALVSKEKQPAANDATGCSLI
jgi:hypothetical protein